MGFSALHTIAHRSGIPRLSSLSFSRVSSEAPHRGWKPRRPLWSPLDCAHVPGGSISTGPVTPATHLGAHLTTDLKRLRRAYEHTNDSACAAIAGSTNNDLMQSTPSPTHRIDSVSGFILHHEASLERLQAFLGFPLARIDVGDGSNIGRWQAAEGQYDFPFFPRQTLYEEVPV